MHARNLLRTLYSLAAGLSLLLVGIVVQAAGSTPANVTLSRYEVFALDNAVRLEWSTDTEINVAGFFFRRSTDGANFVDLPDIGFIAATGGDVIGDDYTAVDNTAQNGQTYYYKLYEIETTGSEIELEVRQVTLNVGPSPTTVIIGGGGQPTNTPAAATATPSPTRGTPTPTPRVTASPTPRVTQTATPSPTPRPTTAPPTATPSPTTAPIFADLPPTAAPPTATPEFETPPTAAPTAEPETLFAEAPADLPAETPVPLPTFPPQTAVSNPTNPDNVVLAQAELPGSASPVPISARRDATPAPPNDLAQQPDPAAAGRGRIILWGGFLAAAALFLASIVGSIVLFTRKHNGDEPPRT